MTVHRARRFTLEDEVLLEAIGAQVAAGALSLIGAETLRPLRDRLLAAADPEATETLLLGAGWKRRSTTPVVLRVQSDANSTVGATADDATRQLLCEILTGASGRLELIGDSGSYLMLVETPDAASRTGLMERLTDLARRPGLRLTAGAGPVAASLRDAHQAIRQADLASQWAHLAGKSLSTVVTFEDVAHLQLLPGAALDMSESLRSLLGMLGAVVSYDLENGTDLAQTLEAFFANSGSVARTSEALFIHRNTLRQRIQRIEELIGRSPEAFDDWISAGVASRLVRLSRTELTTRGSIRSAHPCPHGVATSGRSCCGASTSCVAVPRTRPS